MSTLPVDLLTISPHKFYGPKGIGILYVKKGTKIEKLMDGGFNEFNLRAGHENTGAIIGASKAFDVFNKDDLGRIKELKVLPS